MRRWKMVDVEMGVEQIMGHAGVGLEWWFQ